MPRGGKRAGAGRPPGAPNKKTAEMQRTVAERGITPLDYLLSLVWDEGQEQRVRVDAAKAAAPYVHPKLANIDTNVSGELDYTHSVDKQSVEQAVEVIRAEMDRLRA